MPVSAAALIDDGKLSPAYAQRPQRAARANGTKRGCQAVEHARHALLERFIRRRRLDNDIRRRSGRAERDMHCAVELVRQRDLAARKFRAHQRDAPDQQRQYIQFDARFISAREHRARGIPHVDADRAQLQRASASAHAEHDPLDVNRAPAARGGQFAFHLLAEEAEFDRPLGKPPPCNSDPDRQRGDQAQQNLDSDKRRAAYHRRNSAAPRPCLARTCRFMQSPVPAARARAGGPAITPGKEGMVMASTLKPGDPAPPFDLPTGGGGRVSLASLKGKRVVVYFYPKDDTPGCTTEALNFTEKAKQFAAAGAVVVGISRDSPKKHEKFAAKHGLSHILASDEDGAVCERYGVWVEKSMYGRSYMGVERATFLIDPKGRLAQVWRKVKVPGHVDEVLAASRTK